MVSPATQQETKESGEGSLDPVVQSEQWVQGVAEEPGVQSLYETADHLGVHLWGPGRV